MKKLSSYQKLKKENNQLSKLYQKTRKKLHNLGEGISGDDIIMDFDMRIPNIEENKL